MNKTAIIFGVTGMDGSHLADQLLSKDYKVIGVSRRSSTDNTQRISHILDDDNFSLSRLDITESSSVSRLVESTKPDEIYNVAAQSHVMVSFDNPKSTFESIVFGTQNILDSVRFYSQKTRVYCASSSEMFGSSLGQLYKQPDSSHQYMQNEDTPLHPCSPYGVAKLAAHELLNVYRKSYRLFAVGGILFNHDGPRRGENFLTRKVTKYCAELEYAKQKGYVIPKLQLGNLDAKRDMGYAPEYTEAMQLMLQQDEPEDFVIATGKTYTIRDFVMRAFEYINISDWQNYVKLDDNLKRPYEVDHLCGHAFKAQLKLGWTAKTNLDKLISIMIDSDAKKIYAKR